MVEKRIYKEHFLYPNPLSESVASRTTRYRRKRERNEPENVTEANREAFIVDDLRNESGTMNGQDVPHAIDTPDTGGSLQSRLTESDTGLNDEKAYLLRYTPDSSLQELETEPIDDMYYNHNEQQMVEDPASINNESMYLLGEFYAPYMEEEIIYHCMADTSTDDIENLDAEVEIDHSMCLNSVAKEHEKLCTSAQKPIVNLGDSSLFNDCPLSLSSSAILIKKFQMKHGISQAALSDMLKLMKLHFPTENIFPGSLHLFNKHLPFQTDPLEFVYFCSGCFGEIQYNGFYGCNYCKQEGRCLVV